MGAITPVGHTVTETWGALKAGRSGVGPLTLLDAEPWSCQVAAEIKGFDPAQFLGRKQRRYMPFAGQLAVLAAEQALADARLGTESDWDSLDRDQVGVLVGTAGGSTIEETEQATVQLMEQGAGRLSPFQILRLWPNMISFFVAETHQLRGYNNTVCTACAAATQAMGEAFHVLRRGDAQIMLAGGAESMVSETVLAGFTAMRALASSYNDEPQRAMRPFDAGREGFVPAQGSAMFVMESLAHAQARGAHIYAEVLGYGVSNDAFHLIAPDPTGGGAALALRRALDSAGIGIEAVDYINAHGTSTPSGDLAETQAIKAVFGQRSYEIPISSTKSMIGHLMGATGAVEAMACVMTLREGIIHPTINYETPDPECDLDYVPNEARPAQVKVAVSNSFGLGGQNAVLVLGAYPT
jgi:3-oxoacyl-[acyl-carrier-protein] synthase II